MSEDLSHLSSILSSSSSPQDLSNFHPQMPNTSTLLKSLTIWSSTIIAQPSVTHPDVKISSMHRGVEDDLNKARKEVARLEEKLRDARSSASTLTNREQDLVRDLHARDREIQRLRTPIDGSPHNLKAMLETAEKEKGEWKYQADLYQSQLAAALDDLKKFQMHDSSAVPYLQRELNNEREKNDTLELVTKEKDDEVELYRRRYEEVMQENDRLEALLADRNAANSEQDRAHKSLLEVKEQEVETMKMELVQAASLLKDMRDRERQYDEQIRTLSVQLDAVKAVQNASVSTLDNTSVLDNSAVNSAEQYFAKELAARTQDLTDSVKKLENQLERIKHEKIVLEEEYSRLRSRSSAEQTSLQHHIDRLKEEMRSQEQMSVKQRGEIRQVWEEKLKTEQQIREILDAQAIDHERIKSINSLLQQREDEASALRNEVAMLSEQVGEKDGVISQLRAEISRFDEESMSLQRDAENTCELVRVRDQQLVELRTAFERSCEAGENAKQELARCEQSLKRIGDELSEQRKIAAEAKKDAEHEKTRAVTAETQVVKLEADRLYSEQQLANVENEASRLRNEVIELNEKVVSCNKEISNLRKAQEQLCTENVENTHKLEHEMTEKRRLHEKCNELDNHVHYLEEQLETFKHDVGVRDQAILRLRSETEQAMARVGSINEELEQKESDLKRVAQRCRDQAIELRHAMDSMAIVEERLEAAESKIVEITQQREVAIQDARNSEKIIEQVRHDSILHKTEQEGELARLRQQQEILFVERDAAKADVAELSHRLEQAREEIMQMSSSGSDLQVEIHQLNARCRQHELVVKEQNASMCEMKDRLIESDEELKKLREEERQARMELETLRTRCSDLTERLAQSDSKCDNFELQNDNLKFRVSDLEACVMKMESDNQSQSLDLKNSRSRLQELELAIIQMKDIIDSERQQFESVQFSLKSEELMSKDLKEKLSRVSQDNQLLEESYSKLLADFRCYETEHRYKNEEFDEKDKRIDELEIEVENVKLDRSEKLKVNEKLGEKIQKLEIDIEGFKQEREGLVEELRLVEHNASQTRHQCDSQIMEIESALRAREKESEDLRRLNQEQMADYRLLKEDCENYTERIRNLEIDIAATTSDLHQREDVIARLELAVHDSKLELDSARSALHDSEQRVTIMLSEVEQSKRDVQEANRQMKAAMTEQAQAVQKAQVAEEKANVSEIELNTKVAECVKLEGQIRRFQGEMRSMQERVQDAEEDRSVLKENLQKSKAELQQCRENLSRVTAEFAQLKQQNAKSEIEFSGLKEQYKICSGQNTHLEQILSQIQEDLRQERSNNVENSRSNADSRRLIADLKEQNQNYERQVKELQCKLQTKENSIDDVQKEVDDFKLKLKSVRDEMGEMEVELRQVKVAKVAAERETQTVNERMIQLERRVQELLNELDRSRDNLRSAQGMASDREQDTQVLHSEVLRSRTLIAEMNQQIHDLSQQLLSSQQEVQKLREQNTTNMARLQESEEFNATLKQELDKMKETFDKARNQQMKLTESEETMARAQREAESIRKDLETMKTRYEEAVILFYFIIISFICSQHFFS